MPLSVSVEPGSSEILSGERRTRPQPVRASAARRSSSVSGAPLARGGLGPPERLHRRIEAPSARDVDRARDCQAFEKLEGRPVECAFGVQPDEIRVGQIKAEDTLEAANLFHRSTRQDRRVGVRKAQGDARAERDPGLDMDRDGPCRSRHQRDCGGNGQKAAAVQHLILRHVRKAPSAGA